MDLKEIGRLLDTGRTFTEVIDSLVPAVEREMRSRCCLARLIDETIFHQILGRDLELDSGLFDRFRERYFAELLIEGRELYTLKRAESERGRQRWEAFRRGGDGDPTDRDTFARMNRALARYFAAQEGDWSAEVLYHTLPIDPEQGRALFLDLFEKANAGHLLARCEELLSILDDGPPLMDESGQPLTDSKRVYLNARLLFSDDYYGTLRYLDRTELQEEFHAFLKSDSAHWQLQLHAPGGMGKTMFIRWMLSRCCVPRRIPCARFDLDDVRQGTQRQPWEIIMDLINQLAGQIPGGALSYLTSEYASLESRIRESRELAEESAGPGEEYLKSAATAIIDRFAAVLHEIAAGSVLLILDTTEEALLRNKTELGPLLESIARIHAVFGNLRLVVSGRLDVRYLSAEPLQRIEVGGFTGPEATEYLKRRGLTDDPRIPAIVRRCGGVPFKLALFADLIHSGAGISNAEILSQSTIDVVYLIERIVKRIAEPEVRFLVRYGALAKQLDRDFLEHVLLSFIGKALGGSLDSDDPLLDLKALPASLRDPTLYATEGARRDATVSNLWTSLERYAESTSWVRPVAGADGSLSFHELVKRPMRCLVAVHGVFDRIHEIAIDYFNDVARRETDDALRLRSQRLAVFHDFQRHGDAAAPRWRKLLEEWISRDPGRAVRIAAEITDPDYVNDDGDPVVIGLQGRPARPVISRRSLAEAFHEQVVLHLRLHHEGAAKGSGHLKEAETALGRLLDQERRLDSPVVPRARRLLLEAELAVENGGFEAALDAVEQALAAGPAGDDEEARLHELRGDALRKLGRRGAEAAYEAATARRDRIVDPSLALKTLDQHLSAQRYSDALRAARGLLDAGAGDREEEARKGFARALLAAGQPQSALRLVGESPRLSKGDALLLRARGHLEMGNPAAALSLYRESPEDHETVSHELVLLRICAALMEFPEARAYSTRILERTTSAEMRAQAFLQVARMELFGVGDLAATRSALQDLESLSLPARDPLSIEAAILWLELYRVWADIPELYRTLDDLRGLYESGLEPWSSARIAAAGLVYGEDAGKDRFAAMLESSLVEVQLPTARARVLALLKHARFLPSLPGGVGIDLRALLPDPDESDEMAALQPCDRALYAARAGRVYRLFGESPAARRLLRRSSQLYRQETVYFPVREILLDLDGLSTGRRSVAAKPEGFEPLLKAHHEFPLFQMAVMIEHAERLIDARKEAQARELKGRIDELRLRNVLDGLTKWQARELEVTARLEEDPSRAAESVEKAAGLYESLGNGAMARRIRETLEKTAADELRWTLSGAAGIELLFKRSKLDVTLRSGEDVLAAFSPDPRGVLGEYGVISKDLVEELASDWLRAAASLAERILGSLRLEWLESLVDADHCVRVDCTDSIVQALPFELLAVGDPPTPLNLPAGFRLYRAGSRSHSQHSRVEWLQRALARVSSAPVAADGWFGPATQAAVREFQRERGLEPAPELSAETLRELGRAIQEEAPRGALRVCLLQSSLAEERIHQRGLQRTGVRVEDIYRGAGLEVRVVETLEEKYVEEVFGSYRPDVIHVVSPFRESSSYGDLSIDFSGGNEPALTSKAFNAVIDALTTPFGGPLVILDAPRPSSRTEALRQLLLRNAFGSRVHSGGAMRNVLAIGFGPPEPATWDRYDRLVKALLSARHVLELAAAVKSEPSGKSEPPGPGIEAVLPAIGAALFSPDPFLPLVFPGRLRS